MTRSQYQELVEFVQGFSNARLRYSDRDLLDMTERHLQMAVKELEGGPFEDDAREEEPEEPEPKVVHHIPTRKRKR